MASFEIYLIKSTILLSGMYLLYWILFRNETYHGWNRTFLLMTIFSALVVPVLGISISKIPNTTFSNVLEPVIASGMISSAKRIANQNSMSVLSIIYISGAVFFALRFLSGLAKIHYLYQRFPRYSLNGFKAVVIDKEQSPFSFFNILFISQNDFRENKTNEIIVHEEAHRDAYHSFDVLLLEFITIIQWFNPLIWMFRNSLKSEHEFLADNKVLKEGFDKVKYQKLLFEKSLGITSISLTNGFNYSLLKKRLKMMTMRKSKSWVKIKYLLSIPVLLITIMLSAINLEIFSQDDKVYQMVDEMALYKGGDISGVRNFIAENITYPESARDNKISGRIFVQFVIDEKGNVTNVEIARTDVKVNPGKEVVVKGYTADEHPEIDEGSVADLEAEAIRVIKLLTDLTPGKLKGKPVKTQYTFPIVFVLGEKKEAG